NNSVCPEFVEQLVAGFDTDGSALTIYERIGTRHLSRRGTLQHRRAPHNTAATPVSRLCELGQQARQRGGVAAGPVDSAPRCLAAILKPERRSGDGMQEPWRSNGDQSAQRLVSRQYQRAPFIWLADGAMMSGMRFAGEGGKHDVCCPRCRW